MQSDLQIRLIRILDVGQGTASFWYLHRCGLSTAGAGIDFGKLKDFSLRLKRVRDKSFVHIDKDAYFDPERLYAEAQITDADIANAIEQVWTVLCRLSERYGERIQGMDKEGIESLGKDFKRDFLEVRVR